MTQNLEIIDTKRIPSQGLPRMTLNEHSQCHQLKQVCNFEVQWHLCLETAIHCTKTKKKEQKKKRSLRQLRIRETRYHKSKRGCYTILQCNWSLWEQKYNLLYKFTCALLSAKEKKWRTVSFQVFYKVGLSEICWLQCFRISGFPAVEKTTQNQVMSF